MNSKMSKFKCFIASWHEIMESATFLTPHWYDKYITTQVHIRNNVDKVRILKVKRSMVSLDLCIHFAFPMQQEPTIR